MITGDKAETGLAIGTPLNCFLLLFCHLPHLSARFGIVTMTPCKQRY
jgi:hypothetical protein